MVATAPAAAAVTRMVLIEVAVVVVTAAAAAVATAGKCQPIYQLFRRWPLHSTSGYVALGDMAFHRKLDSLLKKEDEKARHYGY